MTETTSPKHLSTDTLVESTTESIITDSLVKEVLTAFVTIVWLYKNLVNLFIIFVIKTSNSLKENYQYPALTCIKSDVILSNFNMMITLRLVIANDVDRLPRRYCHAVTSLMAGALVTNIWMIGYLAYEHYVYFDRPLIYQKYFSSTNNILANTFMYTVGFSAALLLPSCRFKASVDYN